MPRFISSMYIFTKQINLNVWALVIGIISSPKHFKPQYIGHWSELIPSKLVSPEDSAVLDFEEKDTLPPVFPFYAS